MVIERFQGGNPGPVGERFKAKGRMMPENIQYHTSLDGGERGVMFSDHGGAERGSAAALDEVLE